MARVLAAYRDMGSKDDRCVLDEHKTAVSFPDWLIVDRHEVQMVSLCAFMPLSHHFD